MKMSKTSANAALALAYLARQPAGTAVQARQVGEALGVATDSMLKILQGLSRQGLVHSRLGRRGGYRLDRPAQQITLLQIVEVADGPITGQVAQVEAGEDHLAALGVLQNVSGRVADRTREELARITVADLAYRAAAGPPQSHAA